MLHGWLRCDIIFELTRRFCHANGISSRFCPYRRWRNRIMRYWWRKRYGLLAWRSHWRHLLLFIAFWTVVKRGILFIWISGLLLDRVLGIWVCWSYLELGSERYGVIATTATTGTPSSSNPPPSSPSSPVARQYNAMDDSGACHICHHPESIYRLPKPWFPSRSFAQVDLLSKLTVIAGFVQSKGILWLALELHLYCLNR